ncbi:UNVERIFIED_CONTAM: hypothetical protein KB579_03275 [Streptococcus canis]|uniref:hypothetical protein n=1 Tax=Streptococcus canis TaxID=1329 RepID=UPI0012F0DA8A|nr:hypothetical protein [Streptococcus canis]QKG74513.1 hypothetical protein GE023_009655 [Streptococcus canis]QKG75376.1 hypothetical protein GE022_003575 [Streptococcus canis]GFE45359.1 hypothetical protein ScFU6_11280 [Streptococcus canis]
MEQERGIYQIKKVGQVTGDFLIKMALLFFERSSDALQAYYDKPKAGEVRWNRLMASSEEKNIKDFRTSDISMAALKTYLAQYGVMFAKRDLGNGMMSIAFEAKNREIIAQAFSHFLDQVTSPEGAKDVTQALAVNPKAKSLEKRLESLERQAREEQKQADKTKQPKKSKAKTSSEVTKS